MLTQLFGIIWLTEAPEYDNIQEDQNHISGYSRLPYEQPL